MKGNILGLEMGKVGRRKYIKSEIVPTALSEKFRTKIQHLTARQRKRLFNAIPYTLHFKSDISPDTFKGHLDEWLRTIPGMPRISVPAESNSICKQSKQVGQVGNAKCG